MLFNQCDVSRVAALHQLNPAWGHSQFVSIGNPHCVTLVAGVEALPGNSQMRAAALSQSLTRIAYAAPGGAGVPCPRGVNLQWAWHEAEGRIAARVFERGEGPTASSGTSASAVASAAWRVGWVQAGAVSVVMPGALRRFCWKKRRVSWCGSGCLGRRGLCRSVFWMFCGVADAVFASKPAPTVDRCWTQHSCPLRIPLWERACSRRRQYIQPGCN